MTDQTLKEIVEELTQASKRKLRPEDIFEALGIYDDKLYEYHTEFLLLNHKLEYVGEMPTGHEYAMSFMRDYIWFGEI